MENNTFGNLHRAFPYLKDTELGDQLEGHLGQNFLGGLTLKGIRFRSAKGGKELLFGDMVRTHFERELWGDRANWVNGKQLIRGSAGILSELKRSDCFKSGAVMKELSSEKAGFQWLEVLVNPKSWYHLSFSQTFDRQGNLSMNHSGGLRNVLGCLETINFSYDKSLQNEKLAKSNLSINYPIFWNKTSLIVAYTNGDSKIDRNIIEKKIGASAYLKFPFLGFSTGMALERRENTFNPDDVSKEVIMSQILPTEIFKTSFGLDVLRLQIGQTTNIKSRVDFTKVFGDVDYMKLENSTSASMNLKPYLVDFYRVAIGQKRLQEKKVDDQGGQKPKTFGSMDVQQDNSSNSISEGGIEKKIDFWENLMDISIENNSKMSLLVEMNPEKPAKINDLYHFEMSRGFEYLGQRLPALNRFKHPLQKSEDLKHLGSTIGSHFGFSNSTKLFFNSFPLAKETKVLRTFLHHSTYLNSSKYSLNGLNLSSSIGGGISVSLGAANLEFMYNFWHLRSPMDYPKHLQFRISIEDQFQESFDKKFEEFFKFQTQKIVNNQPKFQSSEYQQSAIKNKCFINQLINFTILFIMLL